MAKIGNPKIYEILVTHKPLEEGETCPPLPKIEGVEYTESEGTICPHHIVYQQIGGRNGVPIWKVRDTIKRLFYVKELQTIKLYYGGIRKDEDCYERIPLHDRGWQRLPVAE